MTRLTTRMGDGLVRIAVEMAERGASDRLVRSGMRSAIGRRLNVERARPDAERQEWLRQWSGGPIALVPDQANRQHYEVPPEFFNLILGPRLKYSSCLWNDSDPADNLGKAETRMLDLTADQAGVDDGMRILDLGCGWGSLTLRLAVRFPNAKILAVSNSAPQGEFIRARAEAGRLRNVEHRVVDVNDLSTELDSQTFDRVISVEMFEHARNHQQLLADVADLLTVDGALYLHVFAHRNLFWPFEDDGEANWMARHFFTGGVMPSRQLFGSIAGSMTVADSWWFGGSQYARTLDAWLDRIDANRAAIEIVLRPVYGSETDRWIQRWRMFMMACSEMFAYDGGNEWGVSHQLLKPVT